jgi:hypothetical protein
MRPHWRRLGREFAVGGPKRWETVAVWNRVLVIVGVVVVLLGGVWALQGIGVIGGSVMSNSPTWVVIGAVVLVVGLLMVFLGARKRL